MEHETIQTAAAVCNVMGYPRKIHDKNAIKISSTAVANTFMIEFKLCRSKLVTTPYIALFITIHMT